MKDRSRATSQRCMGHLFLVSRSTERAGGEPATGAQAASTGDEIKLEFRSNTGRKIGGNEQPCGRGASGVEWRCPRGGVGGLEGSVCCRGVPSPRPPCQHHCSPTDLEMGGRRGEGREAPPCSGRGGGGIVSYSRGHGCRLLRGYGGAGLVAA